jgi:hypothetical protein
MGTACACTTPTGAKGEAMTFTRASSGTCLKGGTLTGIANGDLVTCSTDQPRVMPGGDGSGGLGLLVEGPRTNVALRSEAFDNAAWSHLQNTGSLTVTANAATSPENTASAERLQLAATAAGEYSLVYQGRVLNGAASASVFLKGNGTSGVTDLCLYNNGGGAYVCSSCAYVAATWSRCVVENVPSGAALATLLIGNATNYNGGTVRNAVDLYVWGAQWELGAYASSYMKTDGASASRAEDVPSFSLNWQSQTFSQSQIVLTKRTPGDNWRGFSAYYDATHFFLSFMTSNRRLVAYFAPANLLSGESGGQWPQDGSPQALRTYSDGVNVGACVAGDCSSTAGTPTLSTGTTTLYLGRHTDSDTTLDGVTKRFCLDPLSGRCL